MNDLIGAAVVVATLFGGSYVAKKGLDEVRAAALTKAAHGLPSLSAFTRKLTAKPKGAKNHADVHK